MRLAVHVHHPEKPEQDLLRRGFVLDATIIGRLREMGVGTIYVDYPGLEDLDHHLAPLLSPVRQQLYRQIKGTIAAVQKTASPTVGFADYYATTREMIITLLQQGQHPIYLDVLSSRLGDNAVAHATAVAHLSLLLAIRLQRYLIDQRSRLPPQHAAEVVNVGVGGMLHDLGKAKLPAALARYSDVRPPEDPAERAEWEAHSRIGHDMIRGGVEASAAAAVLQHHQHFDGSGFPCVCATDGSATRLSGTKIHIFARIILAADLFDRLSHDPGEGGRLPNFKALHLLSSQYARWLDPEVLKALTQVVLPFPPGMRVSLNDGTAAVVTGINAQKPAQPIVRRVAMSNGAGMGVEGEPIDLSLPGSPTIAAADGMAVGDAVLHAA